MNGMINYEALAGELLRRAGNMANKELGLKHNASGVASDIGFMHGPNGLMRYPGVDPAVFHTVVGSMGIMSQLQWIGSVYMDPLFEILTGITQGDTVERDEVCDDAPTAGVKKGCIQVVPFGWIQRGTQEIDVTRMGQRLDRADPTDLFVVGTPLNNPILPGGLDGLTLGNDALVNEWANFLSNRAIAMHRKLSSLTYTGNPANNTNGYQEFPGLDLLVSTGHIDAITGTACPSIDSLILDSNYQTVNDNAGDLILKMAGMARYARNLAMRTGVDPVRWIWAMREELFYEISSRWPCAYYLGGCTVVDADGQRINIDARDQIELRDQMRQGNFLLIDGMRWDVVFDDSIPEETATDTANIASGCFASDIYLLPMSILGGRSTLYGEYFQFQNPSIASVFGSNFLGRVAGAFLEVPRQTNNCFVLDIHVKPRLNLRTPWLAGKITNVGYCPLLHTREPFPDDPYYVNGGVVGTRAAPTYQVTWD